MRVPTFLLAIALLALAFQSGCGGEKKVEEKVKADSTEAVDSLKWVTIAAIPNPEDELVKAAAEKLVDEFTVNLRAELTKAMSSGNAANAIEICSKKAPELATQLSVGGWTIRRLSFQNRNVNNYPPPNETGFIQHLASDTSLPYFAMWSNENHQRIYTYYAPIRMQAMCTGCHGKTEEMDPAVVAKLKQLYPLDRAVGFAEGDLRGAFAVTALWPAGEAQAKKIVNGTSH